MLGLSHGMEKGKHWMSLRRGHRLTPWSLPSLEYLALLVSLWLSLLASGELQGKTGSRGSLLLIVPTSQALSSQYCLNRARNLLPAQPRGTKRRDVLTEEAAECLGASGRRLALLLFLRLLFHAGLTHWDGLCLCQGSRL